ncbi:unnamed protein product [Nezara viridula]|uniref:Uncharacterized protein n=1 Tax=Nezara viridula TaxID=85310 RepID=A0A9P0HIP0_NEZVI|nr:unnamed protein product [Nezara viridula]
MVTSRYIWPNVKKDCNNWTQACLECQYCEIQPHTRSPLTGFLVPNKHFRSINVDIVRPLPPCKCFRYVLTIVGRFSPCLEATPMPDQTASSVAQALVSDVLDPSVWRFCPNLYLPINNSKANYSDLLERISDFV